MQIKVGTVFSGIGAIELVKKRDHDLDQKSVDDFCRFLGYERKGFWSIIENFYNKEIFAKNQYGQWVLKEPVWKK